MSTDDGLWIGETQLLPFRIEAESQGAGVRIVDIGSRETWYGTFEGVVTVEVDAGDWAGEQAFAEGIGLIEVTWRGEPWQLVYYE